MSLLRKFHDLPQLHKQKFVLTTSHAHIYTASCTCLEDNLEHKMYSTLDIIQALLAVFDNAPSGKI